MFISKYIINLMTRRTLEIALEQIKTGTVTHRHLGTCSQMVTIRQSFTRTLASNPNPEIRSRATSIGARMERSISENRRKTYKGTYKDDYSGDGSYPIKGYGVVYMESDKDYLTFCAPELLMARVLEQRAQLSYMRDANLYHGIDGQQRRLFVQAQLDQFNS